MKKNAIKERPGSFNYFHFLPKMHVMLFSNLFVWFVYITIIFFFNKKGWGSCHAPGPRLSELYQPTQPPNRFSQQKLIFSYPLKAPKGLGLPHEASPDHCGSQISFCKLWRPLPGSIL